MIAELKLNKKQKQQVEIGILALIVLICFFLWNTPFVYPVKLFVVLTHEISHGLAAILSGGKILAIRINEYLGGECISEGGNKIFIAGAGYMGSFVFGVVLFISAYKKKFAVWSCTIISVILLLFTANFLYGGIGISVSMMYVVILFLSPRYFKPVVNAYLLKILGLISILYVLIDIKEDLITFRVQPSDAHMLAELTGVPAILWGILWLAISITAIYFLIKFAYREGHKPVR
jgi:hypothetical protein